MTWPLLLPPICLLSSFLLLSLWLVMLLKALVRKTMHCYLFRLKSAFSHFSLLFLFFHLNCPFLFLGHELFVSKIKVVGLGFWSPSWTRVRSLSSMIWLVCRSFGGDKRSCSLGSLCRGSIRDRLIRISKLLHNVDWNLWRYSRRQILNIVAALCTSPRLLKLWAWELFLSLRLGFRTGSLSVGSLDGLHFLNLNLL